MVLGVGKQHFLQQKVFENASMGEDREVCELFADHALVLIQWRFWVDECKDRLYDGKYGPIHSENLECLKFWCFGIQRPI